MLRKLARTRMTAVFFTVIFLATAALVLFHTTALRPHFALERHVRPTDSQPRLARPPHYHEEPITPPPPGWQFDYRRDGSRYGLSEAQCEMAFPELYAEIDRAVQYRQQVGNVTQEELDVGWRGDGIVRALLHHNQVYIIDAHGVWDHNHRPRALATLHALNRAVTASPEPLPDIEFTMTDHDSALIDLHSNHTTWAYSRLAHQQSLWLMPDFGFWGWPNVGLRSYGELQTILNEDEVEFLDKVPKVVWRGTLAVGSHGTRNGLIKNSAHQAWSDVQTLDWSNKTDIASKLLTMEDHCRYMFTAQTEGNTYSGRLKYLLNCHSILLSHELKWIEHFHHLLSSSGPAQNYVQLKKDFSDLPRKMRDLLEPSTLQSAAAIADNARATFRERYLTPAAEACYWRALIKGWASVQGFSPQIWVENTSDGQQQDSQKAKRRGRGTPLESYVIMEQVDWEIPAKARKVCIEE